MAQIVLIDDDFATEPIVELLCGKGHDVMRYASAKLAFDELDKISDADFVIVDVMMAHPAGVSESRTHGGHRTGLVLAQQLRRRAPSLPLLAFSAARDSSVTDWFSEQAHCRFLSKFDSPSLSNIESIINEMLGLSKSPPSPIAFIVHGHDETAKLDLKNYLQNSLGLAEPIILHEQPSAGKTIIEKFEHFAGASTIAFVLLTPDDHVCNPNDNRETKLRARQNVIFELGYFLGVFGRDSGRVLLLHKGQIDLPSDIAGIVYIDISNGIEAAGEIIRRELKNVTGT